ncbi:DUF3239 domain-containing protein [Staphylococcus chromogenes]|nr:DUF3239 domain-containing protein [Staphylococcus chromogenes]
MNNFHFTVDEAHNKANNEYSKDVGRLQLSAGVLGLISLATGLAIFFFTTAGWRLVALIALGSFALFCLALVFILPHQIGSAQRLYDAYPLVPAIIAEENPRDIVLMALVNVNVDESLPPQHALALRTITKLEGHQRKVGTRVPAVAVSGRRSMTDSAHWDEVSPMPIAWGTPSAAVITEAEKAISSADWRRLEKALPRIKEVQATKYNLLVL